MSSGEAITFVPFTTFIDATFWSEVNKRKVNDWQLESVPCQLNAFFSLCNKEPTGSLLQITHEAFDEFDNTETDENYLFERLFTSHFIKGKFLLTNTKKEFLEDLDRKKIMDDCAKLLWDIIVSKKWLNEPNMLNSFFLTAYADIKQFSYYYWNCIPALLYPNQIVYASTPIVNHTVVEKLYNTSLIYLKKTVVSADHNCRAFVILDMNNAYPLSVLDPAIKDGALIQSCNVVLVFLNASSLSQKASWTLRNLLSAVAHLRPDWSALKILALRRQYSETFLLNISWKFLDTLNVIPKCVGWEREFQTGALKFRKVDLKSMFDPLQIMEESADLNLKLIRWRQAPTIDLNRFSTLHALIIGSGTLGCNLARSLLGWGVRNFTFIDHANVSYNNPIRQSLFTFDDCQLENSQYNKAMAAAHSLRRIFPRVNSKGIDMKIPMPGHPYSENEKEAVQKTCVELNALISNHDVIFLVMDSRESRWLPTLIASCHNKFVITVAMGFDSYVVMRHGALFENKEGGVKSSMQSPACNSKIDLNVLVSGENLGCYFCSDVTAPGNSVADRTLDQQCTISRSGISMIASGMAVEMMASVLQHELRQGAPAFLAEIDENSSLLGGTPHQIRGFISRFHQMTPTVRRFEKCTACGVEVRQKYLAPNNFDTFLHKVFQNSSKLEEITGLTELHQSVDQLHLDMLEMDENESF